MNDGNETFEKKDNEIAKFDHEIRKLIENGRQPEALKLANEYINKYPDSAEAYFLRSYAKLSWNQPNEAIDDLKRAISIEPCCGEYYNALGGSYLEIGDNKSACNEFERAVHVEPNNLFFKSNFIRAKANLGFIDESLAELEDLYSSNPDNEIIKNNLAEIYTEMAVKDWYYDKEEDNIFALTYDHVKKAEEYTEKAKSLSPTSENLITRLNALEESVKIANKRTFTGGWSTLIMALIFSHILFSAGGMFGYLFFICALAYFYALRTPKYVINYRVFSGNDNFSISDRFTALFVDEGWTVFGRGFSDTLMNMAMLKLILGIIRVGIRLFFLPFTVLMALFTNYNKKHAFCFIGFMIALIAVFSINDWMVQMSREKSSINMINAIKESNFDALQKEIEKYPDIYRNNVLNLFHESIKIGNLKSVEYMLTKIQISLSTRNKNYLIDTAIKYNQEQIISYLSKGIFKDANEYIINRLNRKGPYRGVLTVGNNRINFNFEIKNVNGNNFDGVITLFDPQSTLEVNGNVFGNVVKISEKAAISGDSMGKNCKYTLRIKMYNSTLNGQRKCSDSNQGQQVSINVYNVVTK